MKQEQVIELAKKHGATSYAHRSDTKNPAYGFTEVQLSALVAEVEQATLERAAAYFNESPYPEWRSDEVAERIFTLAKDDQ